MAGHPSSQRRASPSFLEHHCLLRVKGGEQPLPVSEEHDRRNVQPEVDVVQKLSFQLVELCV